MKKNILIFVLVLAVAAILGYLMFPSLKSARVAAQFPEVDFGFCEGLKSVDLKACQITSVIRSAKQNKDQGLCGRLSAEVQRTCAQEVEDFLALEAFGLAHCQNSQEEELCRDLFTVLLAAENTDSASCASIADAELRSVCGRSSSPQLAADQDIPTNEELVRYSLDCEGDALCESERAQSLVALNAYDASLCPTTQGFVAQRCPFETAVYAAYRTNELSYCESADALICVSHVFLARALDANDPFVCDEADQQGGNSAMCKDLFSKTEGGRFAYVAQ